jgi:hypothetical protein
LLAEQNALAPESLPASLRKSNTRARLSWFRTTYYWVVVALDADGCWRFGQTWQFTTRDP